MKIEGLFAKYQEIVPFLIPQFQALHYTSFSKLVLSRTAQQNLYDPTYHLIVFQHRFSPAQAISHIQELLLDSTLGDYMPLQALELLELVLASYRL